jgi:hypothetical protein
VKNNVSLFVAAVFLTILGVSNFPRDASNTSNTTAIKAKTNASTVVGAGISRTPSFGCAEIQGRLQPYLIQLTAKDWQLPASCYLPGQVPKTQSPVFENGMRFVIATAPDPISTHLPLMFDRVIEAIQQAAQDDNYTYDSSWFPWNDTSKDYSSFSDQHNAEEAQQIQRQQPGVIVFRRNLISPTDGSPYKDGLVVFVVAEQPTGGVDRDEFQNALGWIKWLGGLSGRELRVLGPTFSGSLPSLAAALQAPGDITLDLSKVIVSSGSVSSDSSFAWFKNLVPLFQTSMEGDSVMLDRFCRYLTLQGYPLDHVALVSEDETAFGRRQETENSTCYDTQTGGAIYLYYPRDIATLRSAYQRQSIFSTGKQTDGNTASTTLRGDLSEPDSSRHDTVRSYGGQLTPLAQESILLGITQILKEKNIDFVVVSSTNSLDQIFLTKFLKRAYPRARIVLDGADLLFARGDEGSSLRGVMTLSTYPLLTSQPNWTTTMLNGNSGSYRIFGEDVANGLYIAARDLFRSGPPYESHVPIINYAPPSWALNSSGPPSNEQPATWVSVIGQHEFWPVATLNSNTLPGGALSPILVTASERHDPPVNSGDDRPLRLPTVYILLMIVCAAWNLLHLLCCLRGSMVPSPAFFRFAQFAPIPKVQHSALIALGSLLSATAAGVTALHSGLLSSGLRNPTRILLAIWACSSIVVAFLAFRQNCKLPVASCSSPTDNTVKWRRIIGVSAIFLFALLIAYHLWLASLLIPANRIPTYWRSTHLLSGVSPLLPELLLLAGLYLWFWFGLRGVALFGDDRPLLPRATSLPELPMFTREQGAIPVEEKAIPTGANYLLQLLVIFLATVGLFRVALQDFTVRTLGERPFGNMIFVGLSLCTAIVLADTFQLWTIWKNLRQLLVHLDRLPMRRTLASLKGLSWGSVWSVSGVTLEERYRHLSRQVESLSHLEHLLGAEIESSPKSAVPMQDTLKEIRECQAKKAAVVKWYVSLGDQVEDLCPLHDFQDKLAETTASVLKNVLMPAWQRETTSLILKPNLGDKENDGGNSVDSSAQKAVPLVVRAAEEFVALLYMAFIQNVLGRIRTIVLGALFLFVAVTFAVSSYPFNPLPVLGAIFLAVFAITGVMIFIVFAGMHRDATLSHITNTEPGELDSRFWLHLITFGIGPLFGLLTTLFPSITDFATTWLQPTTQMLK